MAYWRKIARSIEIWLAFVFFAYFEKFFDARNNFLKSLNTLLI
jgi:hypothetical protein